MRAVTPVARMVVLIRARRGALASLTGLPVLTGPGRAARKLRAALLAVDGA